MNRNAIDGGRPSPSPHNQLQTTLFAINCLEQSKITTKEKGSIHYRVLGLLHSEVVFLLLLLSVGDDVESGEDDDDNQEDCNAADHQDRQPVDWNPSEDYNYCYHVPHTSSYPRPRARLQGFQQRTPPWLLVSEDGHGSRLSAIWRVAPH